MLRGFVTAVYSPRGGAGVTTLAVNVAIALAERHPDDTVLLDLDVLFGHALANLCARAARRAGAGLAGHDLELDRAGLNYYLLPHSSSLRIFPAAARPEEGQTITAEHVRAAVTTLRRHFGHIVLDLPHGFNEVTLAGLELADRVLLLATPEQVTLQDIAGVPADLRRCAAPAAGSVTYVLNHPQPYAGVAVDEFATADQAAWTEIPYGGEAAASPPRAANRCWVPSRTTPWRGRSLRPRRPRRQRRPSEAAALSGRRARVGSGMLQTPGNS